MGAYRKTYDSWLMTVLVQMGAGVSGAVALGALVVALWPQADASVLASGGQPIAQETKLEIAMPSSPPNRLPDGVLIIEVIEDQKPSLKFVIPGVTAPSPY